MSEEKNRQTEADALRDSVIRRMAEMPPKHKPKTTTRQDARQAQASSVPFEPKDKSSTKPKK